MSEPVKLEEAISDFLWTKMSWDDAEACASEIMKIIEERLGADHFVTFAEDGWFIEHSSACRLAGAIATCPLHKRIARMALRGPEPGMGRWRITEHGDGPLGFDRA